MKPDNRYWQQANEGFFAALGLWWLLGRRTLKLIGIPVFFCIWVLLALLFTIAAGIHMVLDLAHIPSVSSRRLDKFCDFLSEHYFDWYRNWGEK